MAIQDTLAKLKKLANEDKEYAAEVEKLRQAEVTAAEADRAAKIADEKTESDILLDINLHPIFDLTSEEKPTPAPVAKAEKEKPTPAPQEVAQNSEPNLPEPSQPEPEVAIVEDNKPVPAPEALPTVMPDSPENHLVNNDVSILPPLEADSNAPEILLPSAPAQTKTPVAAQTDKPETTTAAEPKSAGSFDAVEALEGAKINGNLALLKHGSKNRVAIETAQKILVETGFLQTEDKSADNYINPAHFGHMDGKVTTNAMHNLQKAMKATGADIKVDSPKRVRCYTETWTALAAAQHAGIRNGEITPEAVSIYSKSKEEKELNAIALNIEVINAVEDVKEQKTTSLKPTNIIVMTTDNVAIAKIA